MGVNLIIFDLDGTLIDSSGDITNALNYAIAPYSIPRVTIEETIALVGEGVATLIGKLLERKQTSLDKATLVNRFLEYYRDHLADETRPFPGVLDVLDTLKNYKKAVLSNKLEYLVVEVLERLELKKYFQYVSGGDSSPEKKPSPLPVQRALETMHIPPEQALMVGDSIYDIRSGNAAGVTTVAVTYGFGVEGFEAHAHYVINEISELPLIVRQICS